MALSILNALIARVIGRSPSRSAGDRENSPAPASTKPRMRCGTWASGLTVSGPQWWERPEETPMSDDLCVRVIRRGGRQVAERPDTPPHPDPDT
jgi:hypothetical protein